MKIKIYLLSLLILAGMMSCQQEDGFVPEEAANLLTRSGGDQEYESVEINGIEIMTKNLNVGTYVSTVGETNKWLFDNLILQKWAYNNIEWHCDNYGGLYEWWQVMTGGGLCPIDPSIAEYITLSGDISSWKMMYGIKTINVDGTWHVQGICPDGWHLPSKEEWSTIAAHETVAPAELELKLGGVRSAKGPIFHDLGITGYWWSSTEATSGNAWTFGSGSSGKSYIHEYRKNHGFSVRCVRN